MSEEKFFRLIKRFLINELIRNTTNFLIHHTIEELDKELFEHIFEWKIDYSNSNLIPVLNIYDDNGNIKEKIEATMFSDVIQELLKLEVELHQVKNKLDMNLKKGR